MDDQTFKILAMVVYMAAMLGIGWYAYSKTSDLDDYMLAGRGLRPGTAALSAGASDMSSWLLMGLPGAVYTSGLIGAWMAIGLTIGAWLNWKFVAPRLRSYTEVSNNSITVPSFLENRLRDRSRLLRIVSGVIILSFFTFYVSSGMVAGGTFFDTSFNSSYFLGMVVVAGVTIAYTLFGGFMGATFTDVAQGLLMLTALIVVPIIGLTQVGGFGGMFESINQVDPTMTQLVTGGSVVGIISAAAWGLGYFGQPHIIVRFMALRSPKDALTGRRIGISWMFITVVGAVLTALVGIAYYQQNPQLSLEDPEAVFLALADVFFHPFVAGIVLAAVLAAIMSTISSQLVVSSSALVEDLYNMIAKKNLTPKQGVILGRLGVLAVSIIAIALAAGRNESILSLVSFAWAGFGASFGPIVLLALYWKKLTAAGALSGLIVGAATVFIWGNTGASDWLYEIVPGFVFNMVVTVVVSLLTYKRNPEIEAEFAEAIRRLDAPAPPDEKEHAAAQ